MENGGSRDSYGRFYGARLNLEFVPRLPAVAVRAALDDPLRRPYLFVWKLDGRPVNGAREVVDAVRVTLGDWQQVPYPDCPMADVRRPKDPCVPERFLRTRYRPLPRGFGRELLLVCGGCDRPKRFLYAWENAGDGPARFRFGRTWRCRSCAGLSFASEGEYDPLGWGYPRPHPWNPYVFSSAEEGAHFVLKALSR
jgi:hypothetical protein